MRITVVHNPTAGRGTLSRAELEGILRDAGYHVRYQTTKGKWKKVLQLETDLVLAAGGDGTVRKVATELAATTGTKIPFAVAPSGTANNFAHAIGIGDELARRVREWPSARPRLIDLGMVTVRRRSRPFVEGAGGGVFAAAIGRGPDEVEARIQVARDDETRLGLELISRLVDSTEPARWEIVADGRDLSGDYVAVEALNIGFVGPSVPLARRADPGDGQLDLVVIDDAGRRALKGHVERRLGGDGAPGLELPVQRFRRAHLKPPHGDPFRIDDRSRPWRGRTRSVAIEIVVRPAAVAMLT